MRDLSKRTDAIQREPERFLIIQLYELLSTSHIHLKVEGGDEEVKEADTEREIERIEHNHSLGCELGKLVSE